MSSSFGYLPWEATKVTEIIMEFCKTKISYNQYNQKK